MSSRRRRHGERRAAKVEARRKRRQASVVTQRPPTAGRRRAGTAAADPRGVRPSEPGAPSRGERRDRLVPEDGAEPLGRALDAISEELGPWWERDDELEDLDEFDELEELEEGDAHLEVVTRLCTELRDVVAATLERQDPQVARAFVGARVRMADQLLEGTLGLGEDHFDVSQVVLTLRVWLLAAPTAGSVAGLAWVAENLGESGPNVRRAARILEPGGEQAGDESDIPALIWLMAGVVAVGAADRVLWLKDMDACTRRRDR
jgi:hypothetical protein